MLELRPLSLDEVREHWDWLDEKLWIVVRKASLDFIPADVFREVSNGDSFLYLVVQDETTVGFMVFSEYIDRYRRCKCLHVDLSWIDSHIVDDREVRDRIDELAVSVGASKIELSSSRGGWDRRLPQLGYTRGIRTYQREVL